MHKEEIMAQMTTAFVELVTEFVLEKHNILNSSTVPGKSQHDYLIVVADDLGLPASKAQLERYRDHYYPESK